MGIDLGERIEAAGRGDSFKWAHVPRSGRLEFMVAVDGWAWYRAHYLGRGYVRCQGKDCPWCDRQMPILRRMVLGGKIDGKQGQWCVELPEGAGAMVQEISAVREGIRGVLLSIRREGQAGRGEITVRDMLPDVPKGPAFIDGRLLVAWLEKQDFWRGWTGPHESKEVRPEEDPFDPSART